MSLIVAARSCTPTLLKNFLCSFTDQEVVAKLAELDMMVADLERANSRVVTVERRNVRTLIYHTSCDEVRFIVTRNFSVRKLKPSRAGTRALTGRLYDALPSAE